MKSTYLKFLFVLAIFSVGILSTSPGTSTNPLTNGQQFVYNVGKYHISLTNSTQSLDYTTFKIAGSQTMTPGTSGANFSIRYLSSDSSTVTFEFVKGSNTLTKTINNTDPFGSGAIDIPSGSNSADFVNDIAYGTLPFILPVTGAQDPLWTSTLPTDFPTTHQSATDYGIKVSLDISTSSTSSRYTISVAIKENGVYNGPNGYIVGLSTGDNVQVDMEYTYVYDITTGVLLGIKDYISIDMTLSSQTFSLLEDIQITRSDFNFAGKSSPGFETAPVLISLFMVAAIVTKLKRRNPKK